MANLILTAFSYPNSLRVSGAPFLYKWTACIDYSPTGGRTESTIHGSPRGKTTHFLIQSNGYGIALLLYVNKTTWSRLHVMKQVVFTHIYIYIHVTTCIYILCVYFFDFVVLILLAVAVSIVSHFWWFFAVLYLDLLPYSNNAKDLTPTRSVSPEMPSWHMTPVEGKEPVKTLTGCNDAIYPPFITRIHKSFPTFSGFRNKIKK